MIRIQLKKQLLVHILRKTKETNIHTKVALKKHMIYIYIERERDTDIGTNDATYVYIYVYKKTPIIIQITNKRK